MKKKIIIAGLLMGVLSLNSCVKDNESDAVRDQRNAQTEKLKAEAAKALADAEHQKALAAVQNANAELAKAKQQYLVELERLGVEKEKIKLATNQDKYDIAAAGKVEKIEAGVQSATAAMYKAKEQADVAVAKYKETIKAQVEAAILDAKVTAENSLSTSKENRLTELVGKLGAYQSDYTSAVSDVVDRQNELNELELAIAQAKADVTSVETLYKKYVEGKKVDIEKQKAIIEAYKEYASTNNPDATYAKLEAAKVAVEVAKQTAEAASEEAKSANEDFKAMDFEAMLDLKVGESASKLSFFEALDKLYKINNDAIVVGNIDPIDTDNVRAKLEVEGTEEYDISDSDKFTVTNLKTYTAEQLISRFVDNNFINFEIKKIKAGAVSFKEVVKTKKADLKTFLDGAYKTAEDDYKADPVANAAAYQAAIDQRRFHEKEVKDAERDLANAEEEAVNLQKYQKQAEDTAKEVVAKIAEFKKAQEAVVAKAKVYEEKVKAQEVADAKVKAIQEILGSSSEPLTVEGAKAKIEAAETQIAILEGQLLKIASAPKGAKDVVAQMEKDKQTKEFELEEAKQRRDAYKKAYDQALEALKDFQKNS